jgi:HJR/Mrr/RecB family endonuclease
LSNNKICSNYLLWYPLIAARSFVGANKNCPYIFEGCKSGTDFENIAVEFLRKLRFKANKTGNNDGGIDVVATITFLGTEHKYYIQCKYYNKPLDKGPIQEVYADSHYYDGEGNDKVKGRPLVMTNNRVTYDARVYAKRLGVEIIADTEWNEIKRVGTEKRITDPNVRPGMLGIILSLFAQDAKYLSKVLKSMDTNEPEPIDMKPYA